MNISDQALFETRIADWLADDPRTPPDEALSFVLASFPAVKQSTRRVGWRLRDTSLGSRLVAATAIVIALVVGVYLLGPPLRNAIGGPTPSASPSATPVPTPTASLGSAPIFWTVGAWDSDWPGPIRLEPSGGGFLVDSTLRADSVGELGPNAPAWIDITEVGYQLPVHDSGGIGIHLGADLNPAPHPQDAWIAYGIVVDKDGDFIADQRAGMDNATGAEHRQWVTDLRTGETDVSAVGSAKLGGLRVETYYLGDPFQGPAQVFLFTNVALRFYAWASLIQDGVVVATDFAPDAGWFQRPPP